jgi:hypothetical protein
VEEGVEGIGIWLRFRFRLDTRLFDEYGELAGRAGVELSVCFGYVVLFSIYTLFDTSCILHIHIEN